MRLLRVPLIGKQGLDERIEAGKEFLVLCNESVDSDEHLCSEEGNAQYGTWMVIME